MNAPNVITLPNQAADALHYFRQGMDTFDIARFMCITESRALALIHQARNAERAARGLPL